jgi:cytochrome c oxidase cbb3-type subunit III
VLLSGFAVAGQALATDPVPPDVKSDHSISQDAFAGGMDSGSGNFMQNCMPCHGAEGQGDGPLSYDLGEGVVPRNLTDAAVLSTRSDEFLFNVIKNGGKSVGLNEVMPDWGYAFDDQAIKNLVQYIRELCNCKYNGG